MTSHSDKTQHDFQLWAKHYMASVVMKTLEGKGAQYSPRQDSALGNFYAGAAMLGTTPMAYLVALATKHWYALSQWATGRRPSFRNEDIQERASDVIIYLLLLMFWSEHNTPKKED